jgi:hypothetical protein
VRPRVLAVLRLITSSNVALYSSRLLRACRSHPCRGAREDRDQIPPLHSITLSPTDVQVGARSTILSSLVPGRDVQNFTERGGGRASIFIMIAGNHLPAKKQNQQPQIDHLTTWFWPSSRAP